MEHECERSQTNEGLVFEAPSRLLSSIPDRVIGQESLFAEFPKNVFLGLALTLETSLICILLLASRDVHFDKRMICFLSNLL